MEVLFSDFKQTAEFDHTHAEGDVTGLTAALAAKAASNHNHDATYAPLSHNHTGVYSPVNHDHAGVYSPVNHNHDASYSAIGHSHPAPLLSSLLTFVGSTAGNVATGANVTPVSLTGLVFNFEANSKYRIWFMGLIQPGAATTGCGFQIDVSAAVTSVWVQFFHQLANTGTQSGGHSIADDTSVGVSSGFPATSTYPVNGIGLLVTGANTGTAQLRLRSETTAAVTAIAGFTLVVEKIA